jgi:hypothetical protein
MLLILFVTIVKILKKSWDSFVIKVLSKKTENFIKKLRLLSQINYFNTRLEIKEIYHKVRFKSKTIKLSTYSCGGDLDSFFIIHIPSFRVHTKKGVLMHDMKVCKPKAAGCGICHECYAPKVACFKGTQ